MFRYLPLLLLLFAALIALVSFRDTLTFAGLRDNRAALLDFRDSHYVAAVAVFLAAYTVQTALSLPGATIATLTGGFLFGVFPGTLFNMLAATAGATLLFLAVRWGFGAQLAARVDASEGRVRRLKDGLDRNQWSVLFLMRLVPVVPFFVANLVPALLNVPLGRFVVSTFVGILPGALVYTSVGAGLGQVFDAGTAPDLGVIFAPHILGPLLGLCALAALPMVIRRRV